MIKLFLTFINLLFLSSVTSVPTTIAQIDSNKDSDDLPNITRLHELAPSLKLKALNLAANAYTHAYEEGTVKKPILTVIDYSLPSSQKRMWVFDVAHDQLLYKTYVAHGKNSGDLYAKSFSNIPQSKASSLGAYLTKGSYYGSKGMSLNLKGLEKDFNNNAFSRRVVIHGAWYVKPDFIQSHGRAGRSWGCPAVSPKLAKPIINTIKNGSIVFAYYPDKKYLSQSDYAQA